MKRRRTQVRENKEIEKRLIELNSVALQKETSMMNKLKSVQSEIYELKAYYESYTQKLNQEKDAVVSETQEDYTRDIEPVEQKTLANLLQIENLKAGIRDIKEEFQGLRSLIIEKARTAETAVQEVVRKEMMLESGQIVSKLKAVGEETAMIADKIQKTQRSYQAMASKLGSFKTELASKYDILQQSKNQLDQVEKAQAQELEILLVERDRRAQALSSLISEIELIKGDMSNELDSLEKQFEMVQARNRAHLALLGDNLQAEKQDLAQLEEVEKRLEVEQEVILGKQKDLLADLDKDLKTVILGSLN